MTKLRRITKEDYSFGLGKVDEDATIPIQHMRGEEAMNILHIMEYQQEMFLGGMNDELMSTSLGTYTETKEQFENILNEWKKLFVMVEKQEAND